MIPMRIRVRDMDAPEGWRLEVRSQRSEILPTSDFRLLTSDFRLPTSDFQLLLLMLNRLHNIHPRRLPGRVKCGGLGDAEGDEDSGDEDVDGEEVLQIVAGQGVQRQDENLREDVAEAQAEGAANRAQGGGL